MFDQTFVDGVGKTNKSWTVMLSFTIQIVIIGVLVILPLIFTDVLPQAQLVRCCGAGAPAASSSASSSDTRQSHQGSAAPV